MFVADFPYEWTMFSPNFPYVNVYRWTAVPVKSRAVPLVPLQRPVTCYDAMADVFFFFHIMFFFIFFRFVSFCIYLFFYLIYSYYGCHRKKVSILVSSHTLLRQFVLYKPWILVILAIVVTIIMMDYE